jgi:hypothetical protein
MIKSLTLRHKDTASQRIEISRKEQKEQKNNKCQPHQKFVIPDRSLTGSGIQGNDLKPSNALITRIPIMSLPGLPVRHSWFLRSFSEEE